MRRTIPTANAAIAALTAVLYGAWLGWDQDYDVDPVTGELTGPYEAWQVVGLVLCLAAVAVVAGRLGHRRACRAAMPVAYALCFAIDGATDANSDGLWGVGAVLAFGAVWLGATVATRLGELSRRGGPAEA